MLQLVQKQFHRGPNIRSRRSGLVILMQDDGPVPALAWRPAPGEAARVLDAVRASVAVAPESENLASPQALCDAPVPLLHLMLATAEVILRDFVVAPALGRVHGHKPHRCTVYVCCDEAASGLAAWAFGMQLAASLDRLRGDSPDPAAIRELAQAYAQARRSIRRTALNQSSIGIVRAAARLGIPHYRLGEENQFVQLGQGRHAQRIMETATDTASILGRGVANDKLLTSRILQSLGLPTALTRPVADADAAVQAAERLGYPVVVKPRSAGKGRGVSVDLRTEAQVRRAVEVAQAVGAGLVVERHIEGDDHRLLVVGGRFVAAARRDPAHVTGDGVRNVRELVRLANRDPRRGVGFERVMERIALDDEARLCLESAGLTEDSVPEAGKAVFLRGAANMSRGGSSEDVTARIHPDNARLAERAAAAVGLCVTGIDFQTPDITRSWRSVRSAILEVNATPGLRPHQAADARRDVFGSIVRHLYPKGAAARVPTVGITGSLGKTSTCRLVSAILAQDGGTVALATTQGMWVGGELRKRGDFAGGTTAAVLLTDPGVDAAVFEFARGGLLRRGLVLDAIDVGVVLNVLDNHVGMDGIGSRSELARVKRLVVENARQCAVLNADDPQCLAMRPHVKARVALVTRDARNPEWIAHRAGGGLGACFDTETRRLELFDGAEAKGGIAAAAVASTWDGRFMPAVDHALVAMVVAHALGLPFERTAAVLGRFESTDASNPGRMNLHRGLPHSVLVSHADGPQAMAELASFVRGFEVTGRKIMLLCAAGNRPDGFISGIAHAAAGAFDTYVCTDWGDLRGREPGAAARLLASGLASRGVAPEGIVVARDIEEAVRLAYAELRAGDLVVDNSYSDSDRDAWLRARSLPTDGAASC